jgi:hypothetical protein
MLWEWIAVVCLRGIILRKGTIVGRSGCEDGIRAEVVRAAAAVVAAGGVRNAIAAVE